MQETQTSPEIFRSFTRGAARSSASELPDLTVCLRGGCELHFRIRQPVNLTNGREERRELSMLLFVYFFLFAFISQCASAGSTSATSPLKPVSSEPTDSWPASRLDKGQTRRFSTVQLKKKKGRPPPRYLRSSLNESLSNCTLINTVSAASQPPPPSHSSPYSPPPPLWPFVPLGSKCVECL